MVGSVWMSRLVALCVPPTVSSSMRIKSLLFCLEIQEIFRYSDIIL